MLVPERDKVFPNLTVAENLLVPVAAPRRAAPSGGGARSQVCSSSRSSPSCASARPVCCRAASGRCWRIAGALVCKPELLLVDELSLGLAPVVVEDSWQRLLQIRSELGIDHRDGRAERGRRARASPTTATCWRTAASCSTATAARLAGHPDIQEFYLGQSSGGKRRSYRDVKQYRRSRRWYG